MSNTYVHTGCSLVGSGIADNDDLDTVGKGEISVLPILRRW